MVQQPVCRCGEELNQSIVFSGEDVKSCPNCSSEEGVHVFYEYEAFGYRNEGRHVQSWCTACRDRAEKPEAFMRC